jgi:hypothetical protein
VRLYATAADGRAFYPENVFKRITWMGDRYCYVPGDFEIRLPVGRAKLEVVKGFDYLPHVEQIDIRGGESRELLVKLERVIDMAAKGWYSGDGHIHMSYGGTLKMTPEQAILMLQAEDLNIGNMVVANIWGDDVQDRQWFEDGKDHGLSRPRHIMRWNEEYRNNLLGHLILYGIKELTDPIYSGFAGTPHGHDFPLNADIAEQVNAQGGFVTGAHPFWSRDEHALDVVLEKMNGIETLGYGAAWASGEEVLHALWNCGFRTVATAGTDAFLNVVQSDPLGGARCYAKLDGELSYDNWLSAVRAGRTFVSNSPHLFLTVEGEISGSEVKVGINDGKARVKVRAEATSRWPLAELRVYFNGEVVGRSTPESGETKKLLFDDAIEIPHSGWISARVVGPHNRFIFGGGLFRGHQQVALTSPVWIVVDGQKMPPSKDAERLVGWADDFTQKVEKQGKFANDAQRKHMREVFGEARRRFARLADDYRQYMATK